MTDKPPKRPTKKALLEALHAELGKCVSLTDKMDECRNWAKERWDGRGYCGQHIAAVVLAETERKRVEKRTAELNANIDAYLAKTGQEAHVCGAQCKYTSAV